jgi:nucleoside-diphosphate-sugar epimerase
LRVVVTGGSGKAGRAVVADLRAHGHDSLNVDRVPDGGAQGQSLVADLTDLGQAHDVLSGTDAVVHLAAVSGPRLLPAGETFRINAVSTYNVFAAAEAHRLRRVVWASSELVMGEPWSPERPPAAAPVDEAVTPSPESSYALSKLVGEVMAGQFARRTGIPFVGLRFSAVREPEEYAAFPGYWQDVRLRAWNLWSYVDVRDVALSVRLALEAPVEGAETFIVAAADSVMPWHSSELMAEVFPDVPLIRPVAGHETLLSIEKARRLLGYRPEHSWRDHVAAPPSAADRPGAAQPRSG